MNRVSWSVWRSVRGGWLACLAALTLAQLGGCAREHGARFGHDDGASKVPDDVSPDDERATGDDDGARDPDGERVGPTSVTDQDGEPSESEPSIGMLMADMFAVYQRDAWVRCPCRVEDGVYESIEECELAATRSPPHFDVCLDRAVPEDILPELRKWLRCVTRVKEEHNACLETVTCDDELDCRIDSDRCSRPDPALLANVLSQCPQGISFNATP